MAADDSQLISGVNAVVEMLKLASSEIIEVVLADGSARDALHEIRSAARQRNVPVLYRDRKTLDRLVPGQRHQGVVARARPYRYIPFDEMLARMGGQQRPERILLLDGITDPRNLGALIRTADAAGVRFIIIPKDRSADVTPVVTKAAAGATCHVGIVKVVNLRRAITDLKQRGFWVVGLHGSGRETIYQRKFPDRIAIMLGSEGGGLRPIHLRECDFLVSIPMLGAVSSLNVSVAGAVFLYELVRQSPLVAPHSAAAGSAWTKAT
jgi:23S rRNA (guanosine2251-2'-O)-methyltransferase